MALGNIQYKSAVINETNAGDKEIVAAVSSTILNVHAFVLTTTAAGVYRWESGAGGTALTGIMNVAADDTIVFPFSEVAWFSTAAGSSLSMELAVTGDVDGVLIYSESS